MTISRRNWIKTVMLWALIFGAGSARANSKYLNVQGKLTDNSGNPLTGSQTVTFRLYTSSAASVASAIWIESQSVVLSTGLFNVSLGTVTALDSISFNRLYYLGIQVAGDTNELSPRQQLGASAYAQGSLGDFNVGNNLVVGSSVTINSDTYISGQTVIAGTMTVRGSAFSVGGSSFTISGGSVTIAYLLTAASLTANSLNVTSSAAASAFFGDGSHLTGLSTNAVGAMLAGTIIPWGSSTTPSGFLECDGSSVSTATYSLLYSRLNCTWGCADSSHFNLPDMRGVFLRGWNHSASTNTLIGDQDAASRSALKTGGNSGDKVGSYQADELRSHYHTGVADLSSSVTGPEATGTNLATAGQTDSAGGNETRPKNAYVMMIIKTDDMAIVAGGITVYTISAGSSITASAFFGDGSHLSGVSGSEGNTYTSSKTFTSTVEVDGHLFGSSATFTRNGDNILTLVSQTGSGQIAGIRLQRGNFQTDVYNDWAIQDEVGALNIYDYANGSNRINAVFNSNSSFQTRNGVLVGSVTGTICSTCTLQVLGGTSLVGDAEVQGKFVLPTTSSFTVQASSSVSLSTITVTSYPMTDFFSLIASTFPEASNGVTFALDFTTGVYKVQLDWAEVSATTGTMRIWFNGVNTGTGYGVGNNNIRANGQWTNGSTNHCFLVDDDLNISRFIGTLNRGGVFTLNFQTGATRPYHLIEYHDGQIWNNDQSTYDRIWGGCAYQGPAGTPITSIRFGLTNGAQFKGSIRLYRSN